MQKIDVFTHILPPKYLEALYKKTPEKRAAGAYYEVRRPGVRDLDMRLRIMDRFEGYGQIINIAEPTIEDGVIPASSSFPQDAGIFIHYIRSRDKNGFSPFPVLVQEIINFY